MTEAIQRTKSIHILIADDHAVVRGGLLALIGTELGLEVVGEAAGGVEAAQKARTMQPDVILLGSGTGFLIRMLFVSGAHKKPREIAAAHFAPSDSTP